MELVFLIVVAHLTLSAVGLALALLGFRRLFKHWDYESPRSLSLYGTGTRLVKVGVGIQLVASIAAAVSVGTLWIFSALH